MRTENINLHNGDCLEFMRTLPDNSIDMCFTDPPYKTTKRGNAGNSGGILKDVNFLNGKGGFSNNNIEFSTWLPEVHRILKDGAHCYIMCNNKNLLGLLTALHLSEFKVAKTLIWVKNNSIMSQLYMETHEYIIFAYKGTSKRINNCGSKSVLQFNNVKNKNHPSEKPTDLIEHLILNSSIGSQLILDPFVGSGSTGVACVNTNRKFIGCELDKEYFDIAVNRIDDALWDSIL